MLAVPGVMPRMLNRPAARAVAVAQALGNEDGLDSAYWSAGGIEDGFIELTSIGAHAKRVALATLPETTWRPSSPLQTSRDWRSLM